MNTTILEGTKALYGKMKEWMDYMHQHPELALQEAETAKYIAQKSKKFWF